MGGARSTVYNIQTDVLNNLWPDTTSAESFSGSTKYRCIYIYNSSSTSTFGDPSGTPVPPKVWIFQNTPSTDDTIAIGLGTSAINGTEQTIANETIAPSGVTFTTTAIDSASGLSLGGVLGAGAHKALWIRRVINSNAQAFNSNYYIIRTEGPNPAP